MRYLPNFYKVKKLNSFEKIDVSEESTFKLLKKHRVPLELKGLS